ncbi:hypothetical protein F5148DRAFT_1163426, partial [Russula earlei]
TVVAILPWTVIALSVTFITLPRVSDAFTVVAFPIIIHIASIFAAISLFSFRF